MQWSNRWPFIWSICAHCQLPMSFTPFTAPAAMRYIDRCKFYCAEFIIPLIPVNITGLPFTARPFRMALVLPNNQIAHRTRTINVGPTDCRKHIARQRIRGEIEIIHLRFDSRCDSKIQQGNCESPAQELDFSSIHISFQLHISELPAKTPFVCVCIKEMWLMLQLLIEKLHDNGGQLNTFWFYFGDVLKQFRDRKSEFVRLILRCVINDHWIFSDPYSNNKVQSVERGTVNIYPNDSLLFSIWLLKGVAVLNGYVEDGFFAGPTCNRVKEHSDLLESLIRSFLASEPHESNLRSCLLTVNTLLTEW